MLDGQTRQRIKTLQYDAQPAVTWFVEYLRSVGIPARIISARRSPSQQRRLIALGQTSTVRSLHLVGRAIDLNADLVDEELAYAGRLWEQLGGRWGGRFRVPDWNHFDF